MKRLRILLLIICCTFAAEKLYADDFYWIGGSGNWSDINHWGLFSGASSNNGQNYVRTPTADDNVIFDNNSGFTATNKTVTLNVLGYCRDLRFEGTTPTSAPTFTMSNNLEISGSLLLQRGMALNASNRTIYFGSLSSSENGNYTITTNKVAINTYIIFQGNSGNGFWTSVDTLTTSYDITVAGPTWKALDTVTARTVTFSAGSIDWSGQKITITQQFASNSNTLRNLNIQNATINFTTPGVNVNNFSIWDYIGDNASINAVGSSLILRAASSGYPANINTIDTHHYNKIVINRRTETKLNTALLIDTLILMANTAITSGVTVQVNEYLEAKECNAPFSLSSSGQATIDMGTGNTDILNISIQRINITGLQTSYPAIACTDAGGNFGWNFTYRDAYWVGGAGNWSDLSHWASSSGGQGGTICIPNPGTNVFFDELSGFTATSNTVIVQATAYCRDMIWSGMDLQDKPTFSIQGAPPIIYGSLEWQRGMEVIINYISYIRMMASAAATITSNDVKIMKEGAGTLVRYAVEFYGGGTWTFLDDFYSQGAVKFRTGTLIMQGITAEMGGFLDTDDGGSDALPRTLDISNSTIILNNFYYIYNATTIPTWRYLGTNTSLIATGSHLIMNNPNSTNAFQAKADHHYCKITFNYNASIYSSFLIDSLVIGGSNIGLSFNGVSSLIVNDYLEIVDCGGRKSLSYNYNFNLTIGNPGTATVRVENAQLTNINIVGNTPYTVINTLLTNSNGWQQQTVSQGGTLYWVGGPGNWNDASHWSSVSGVVSGGSVCIPYLGDDVVFNDESGFTAPDQTVTISLPAFCNNMTWEKMTENLPRLLLNNALYVNGSIEWQPGMTTSGSNTIYMQPGANNVTLTNHGVTIPNLNF
ncbi:MAG: hypothetical protein LBI60_01100, partial [Bacteroidales bacterium]|nr:hypothetical protein [Bacteroidales bacterium]